MERWRLQARPEQLPPDGAWRTWYVVGGRGSGKTRTGAETLADWIGAYPGQEWAVVAPTFGAAKEPCVESGTSGLLKWLGPLVKNYNRSEGVLFLEDGGKVFMDGANDGAERIQGKNLAGAWCDEVGLWEAGGWSQAWNESINFAVRFEPGRIIATGTPKQGHPLVKLLLESPHTVISRMRTIDNAANLSRATIEGYYEMWEGTRLGRQELEGEFLEDSPGALWSMEQLESLRLGDIELAEIRPYLSRIVVGVDPSGSRNEDTGTSEQGIVVAGFSKHIGKGYVLADLTCHETPERWAQVVCNAYREYEADCVVAERNYGGDMVRATIQASDSNVPVKLVTASRGKLPRAEPVAAKYEQGKVYHARGLTKLEEQMTRWVPGDPTQDSPDRVDALVWALTELMLTGGTKVYSSDEGERDVAPRWRGDVVSTKHLDEPSPWDEREPATARSYSSA